MRTPHRVARRVSFDGSAADRLRERGYEMGRVSDVAPHTCTRAAPPLTPLAPPAAAFTVFVVLVSRVILAFDLNLYIPLSRVDENMRRAHAKSAASQARARDRSLPDIAHVTPHLSRDPAHLLRDPTSSRASAGDVLVPEAHGATRRGRVRGRRLRRLRGDDGRGDPDRKGATPPPPSSPLRTTQGSTTFLAASPASHTAHATTRRRAPPSHQGTYFPGLLPLTYAYLEAIDCDPETKEVTPHRPTNPIVARARCVSRLTHPSVTLSPRVPPPPHRRCASISTSSAAAPPASCRPARSGCGPS